MNNQKKWYKTWWGVLVIIFILLLVLVIYNANKTANKEKEKVINKITEKNKKLDDEIDKNKSYQEIFTFEGNGAKKSEPFEIIGSQFKIKYDCHGDLCQAYLKKYDGKEWNLELIMNTTEPTNDESIFYGSGKYYIDSNSMGTYQMIVEDYK